jgi:drug/metabolite transporter superfamily protein YnfA
MPIDWEAERVEFQRWYLATQTKQNYARVYAKDNGVYVDRVVRIAWRVWKKATQRAIGGKVATP